MNAFLTRGIGLSSSLFTSVGGALSIAGQTSIAASVGTAFAYSPTVGGGDIPYTFDLATGTLPDGLALDANTGEISGTPTTEETAAGLVIRVTDDAGATATLAPFSIVVGEVTLAAPQAAGNLPDVTFVLDSGTGGFRTIQTAQDFTGEGLVYSVSGYAPATINPANGVVTVPDDTPFTAIIVVTASNGVLPNATSNFALTARTATGSATVTMTDTVTHRNVTFILDRQMPVVRSCLDEPSVISTEPFNVLQILPESVIITGAEGLMAAHGAMLNPGDLSVPAQQGFDGLLGQNEGTGETSSTSAYVAGLNDDPAVNGAIAFAQGATGSLVKSARRDGLTDAFGNWQTIDRYVVLSVLDAVPDEGFFRPGTAPGTKTIYGKESDISYDIFRALPAPVGLPDLTSAEDNIAETYPYFGITNQEKLRRFDVQGGSNYSATYSSGRGDVHALLHTDLTAAEKRLITLRSVQHGIDLAQAQANGYVGTGGAGQNYGRPFFSFVAAFALGSAPLLSAAQALDSAALDQHFWAVAEELERPVEWPSTGGGENERHNAPLLQSDLNLPEWDREPGDPTRRDAAPGARYRQFWPIGMMEALNIALLQNGPGGITGVQAMLGGGAFDETNPAAAALAFYDRSRNWPVDFGAIPETGESDDRFARWDAWRPLFGITPWTGRPDWVVGDGQVTAGDGEITYDWSLHTWATEPILRRDLRYSLDGRQWIEVLDVPAAGSIPVPLRGVPIQVGFRLVSASGPGRWSPTYPLNGQSGSTERNTVAATGTEPDAAPVNTVLPQIMAREVPNWEGSDMFDVGAAFSAADFAEQQTLYAGVGSWTGFPAPAFTYQWHLGGVDLVGETGDSISLFQRFDASQGVLGCRITATNSSNAVPVETATTALPEIVAPGPYLDDFAAGDASAGYTSHNGGTFDYASPVLAVGFNGETFPGVTTRAYEVVPGRTYDIGVDINIQTSRSHEVIVGSTPGGEDIFSSSPQPNTAGDYSFALAVTATSSVMYITVRAIGGTIDNTGFDLQGVSVSEQTAPSSVIYGQPFATDVGATPLTGNVNSTVAYNATGEWYQVDILNRTGGFRLLMQNVVPFVEGQNYRARIFLSNAAIEDLRAEFTTSGVMTFTEATGFPEQIEVDCVGGTTGSLLIQLKADVAGQTGRFDVLGFEIEERT